MIQMQRLQRVMRANAVARGLSTKFRPTGGLFGAKAAMLVSRFDQRVMFGFRNYVKCIGHEKMD